MKLIIGAFLVACFSGPSFAQNDYNFEPENKEYLCNGFADIGRQAMVLRQEGRTKEQVLTWFQNVPEPVLKEGTSPIVEDAFAVPLAAPKDQQTVVLKFERLIREACLQSFVNP